MPRITTAIVLAAGEGTRLRPLTLNRPKHLLPILGKPFIHHLLGNLSLAGIRKIVAVVGYKADEIKPVMLEHAKRLGLKIEFVNQDKPLGTGHALACAEERVKDERFICLAGDNYYTAEDLKAFLRRAEKEDDFLAGGIEVADPRKFGVFSLRGERIVHVVEKPENPPSSISNASLYLFDQSCFGMARGLKKSTRGEHEITDILKILAGRNRLKLHKLTYWTDLGNPWDILDLNAELMKGMRGQKISSAATIEKGVTIKGPIVVGKGTVIKSGAYIEGPVWIGENCAVGPNCYLRSGTVLGDKTGVGQAVEIKNAAFFGRTNVKHLSYVADSVIGENCNLGAGTITANLRFDHGSVWMSLNGKPTDSGRRKLGVVMAENSQTGIHVSILPGRCVGPNSWIAPACVVDRDVPAGKLLKRDGELVDIIRKK